MGAVGERLRRERLKSGLDLEWISQETKIPAHLLHAIEQEEFEKLPGRLFLFNFVRQYAQTLGLDEAQVIAQLRAEQEPPPPAPILPAPPIRPKRTAVRMILGGAAAGVVVFVLAYAFAPSRSLSRVAAPPQAQHVVPRDSADRVISAAPATQRAGAEVPSADRPASSVPVSQPPDAPAPSAGLHLVLTARAPTWVSATQDGRSVFSAKLQPGDTRVLDGGATAIVVISNPEGVDLSLNGKPIDIAGPRGQLAQVRIAAPGAAPVVSHRLPLADLY